MEDFLESVRSGSVRGSTRMKITDFFYIGIGFSDLGPVLASRAIRPYWHPKLRFHPVS